MARDPGRVFRRGPIEFRSGAAAEGFDGAVDGVVQVGEALVGRELGRGRILVGVGVGVGVVVGVAGVARRRRVIGGRVGGFPIVVIGIVLVAGLVVGEDDAVFADVGDEFAAERDHARADARGAVLGKPLVVGAVEDVVPGDGREGDLAICLRRRVGRLEDAFEMRHGGGVCRGYRGGLGGLDVF